MKVWVLRKLRADARAWWYHKALRDRGETEEAGARERTSIRMSLDVIRKTLATTGVYVSTGVGGTTIHYGRGARSRATSACVTWPWHRSSSIWACR